jgi:hypothetical protein
MVRKRWVLPGLLTFAACRLADTTTPTPQPDTVIFGRVAEIRSLADEPGTSEVDIRAGLPEPLLAALRRENRPLPALEKDLLIRVRVGAGTLCVVDMHAVDLDSFRVGQEVTVVPRPGTSTMIGTKLLLAEAAELYLFTAYQFRMLPRSLSSLPSVVLEPTDPRRINSAGTECTPLPLAGGRVVYFAAGLLPPLRQQDAPRGAARPGMQGSGGGLTAWAGRGGYRPYRVAWGDGRWEAPAPVELAGLAPEASARITWISADEKACLVEVTGADGARSLLSSARARPGVAWGPLVAVAVESGKQAGDAQRFGTQLGALVWTAYDAAGSDLWLSLHGQKAGAVDPRINTLGPEWAPRLGPNNALYFCRADRQLCFTGGAVEEVRLPGKQYRPLLEAAPTADGGRLFFRVPRFVPGEPDWDLAVAVKGADGKWGPPVPLDDWAPTE